MAFTYYSPVTVNSGQVPSTQTNFPILINQIDARFKTTGNGGHVQDSNGYDIRPYSDSGLTSALTYELERYNASTGEVVMHVKRASIDDGNVTYLGYGDAALNTDGSDGPNTFSNSFLGVYHLKDGTTLNVNSSTGSNNGTNNGATATTGQIDGGAAFASASSQYIDLSNGINPVAITLSAWVKGTSFPAAYNAVVARVGAGVNYAAFYVKSNGKLAWLVGITGPSTVFIDGSGSNTLSTGTWYYLTLTYSNLGTTGLVGYVNAGSDASQSVGANTDLVATAASTYIGGDPGTAGRNWNGILDEVRVSSIARSQDWITTEYNAGFPATFETLGSEVNLAGGVIERRTLGPRIGSRQRYVD